MSDVAFLGNRSLLLLLLPPSYQLTIHGLLSIKNAEGAGEPPGHGAQRCWKTLSHWRDAHALLTLDRALQSSWVSIKFADTHTKKKAQRRKGRALSVRITRACDSAVTKTFPGRPFSGLRIF